jgi:hypothetical protein
MFQRDWLPALDMCPAREERPPASAELPAALMLAPTAEEWAQFQRQTAKTRVKGKPGKGAKRPGEELSAPQAITTPVMRVRRSPIERFAQFIAATRGRKVDCLARGRDQTCCSISSILRRCAGR